MLKKIREIRCYVCHCEKTFASDEAAELAGWTVSGGVVKYWICPQNSCQNTDRQICGEGKEVSLETALEKLLNGFALGEEKMGQIAGLVSEALDDLEVGDRVTLKDGTVLKVTGKGEPHGQ